MHVTLLGLTYPLIHFRGTLWFNVDTMRSQCEKRRSSQREKDGNTLSEVKYEQGRQRFKRLHMGQRIFSHSKPVQLHKTKMYSELFQRNKSMKEERLVFTYIIPW